MSETNNTLLAYDLAHRHADMPIRTAPLAREWMDATPGRFAYRCLPLTIANTAGWVVLNPDPFTVVWDGGLYPDSLTIEVELPARGDGGDPTALEEPLVSSHFGSGIVTFSLPYLMRTPPDVNLWVKGPSNWFKDGIHPLEGVVEADWLSATFTMNWKLTRPNHPVRFEEGDPICMIVPVARGLAESLEPVYRPLESNPELRAQYEAWSRNRADFNAALDAAKPEAVQRGWQKDYNKGVLPDGSRARGHQTRVRLQEFTRGTEGGRS